MTKTKPEANPYAEKYSQVAARLERADEIEARLAGIEDELKSTGGRIPPAEAAERFARTIRETRARLAANPAMVGRLTGEEPVRLSKFTTEPYHLLEFLILVLGDVIEERAASIVGMFEYEPGAPVAEREAKRAKLAAERAALTREHLAIVADLASDGVTRANLPENQAEFDRRAAEARAAEKLAANQAEARRRLDAASR
jgi:hypothetical protein